VLSSARSDQISGDLVDRLICDNQLELHRFAHPADAAAALALAARCRDAKEQLSTNGAVCMPGEGGLLLLSQDSFDSLIVGPVETSARLTREVIRRSGRLPDAAVLIGGGAHIPLVTSVMESWLDLPVIVPAQPELVAAEGAALLARPASDEFGAAMAPEHRFEPEPEPEFEPEPEPEFEPESEFEEHAPIRKRRGLVLAGSVVAVVAAVGLGLGVGTDLLQGSEEDAQPATQSNTQAPAARQVIPSQPTTTGGSRNAECRAVRHVVGSADHTGTHSARSRSAAVSAPDDSAARAAPDAGVSPDTRALSAYNEVGGREAPTRVP